MRSSVFLAFLLGLVVFLTFHYSFWVACGIIYFAGILVVIVVAFSAKNRQSWDSRHLTLGDKHDQVQFEEQAVAEKLGTT